MIWPKGCYILPERIFDFIVFNGYGSSFCLGGQKSLKSPKSAFTPKRGLIWTPDPDGASFLFGGQPKVSPKPEKSTLSPNSTFGYGQNFQQRDD